MNLFLMRHCTAYPHDEMRDAPLDPLGKSEARLMGRWLHSTGYRIDLAMCSELKRSHQTAKRMARRVDAPLVVVPEIGPDSSPEMAWKAILKAAAGQDHLLVVTHGPLIETLRDWLVGNPGTSRFDQHYAYGCIHHIKDGREHWAVSPHVIARTRDEENRLKESSLNDLNVENLMAALKDLRENLKRASKARILDPLIAKLAAATKRRFRLQGAAVAKAIRQRLQEADTAAARQAASYALAGFTYAAWLVAHKKATTAAYQGGVGIAAGQLDAPEPDGLDGPDSVAETAEGQVDATTRTRVMNAIVDGLETTAILAAVSGVFKDGVESRADAIALTEVSGAFHDGMIDAAQSISDDTGDDVEKHWDAEDDACDDCLDCEDEDWVDLDFTYPAFGVDEPEGHPNCRCSLDVRRAVTA